MKNREKLGGVWNEEGCKKKEIMLRMTKEKIIEIVGKH